jgi:hypothetical protein
MEIEKFMERKLIRSLYNIDYNLGGGKFIDLIHLMQEIESEPKQRLTAINCRRIAEMGYPIITLLADKLKIDPYDVRGRVNLGLITYPLVKEVIIDSAYEDDRLFYCKDSPLNTGIVLRLVHDTINNGN